MESKLIDCGELASKELYSVLCSILWKWILKHISSERFQHVYSLEMDIVEASTT